MNQYFKFILFFISITCFAQTQWEKFTELSDSTLGFARPKNIQGFVQKDNLIIISSAYTHQIVLYTNDGVNTHQKTYIGKLGNENSEFNNPAGLVLDNKNRLFVADRNNHRIQVFSLTGTTLSYMSQLGSLGSFTGQFLYPQAIEVLDSNLLAVSDVGLNKIKIISITGNNLYEVNSFGAYGTVNGNFNQPISLSKDSHSNLYVVDRGNRRIQILSVNGTNLSYRTKIEETLNDSLKFQFINSVYAKNSNKIYVTTHSKNLYIFSITGQNIAFINSINGKNFNSNNDFVYPYFINIDNNRVHIFHTFFNPSTYFYNEYAIYDEANNFQKIHSKQIITDEGQLSNTNSIVTDDSSRLFVMNKNQAIIQMYSVSGNNITYLSKYSPNGFVPYYNFGFLERYFNQLYVVDATSNKFEILTISGNSIGYYTSCCGTGNTDIVDIAIHKSSGKIFISDYLNNKILLITQSGSYLGIVTSLGISGSQIGELSRPTSLEISGDSLFVLNNESFQTEVYLYKILNNGIEYLCSYSKRNGTIPSDNINEIAASPNGDIFLMSGIYQYKVQLLRVDNVLGEYFLSYYDSLGIFRNINVDDLSYFSSSSQPSIHVDNKNNLYISDGSDKIFVYKKKSSLTAINDPKSKSHIDFTIYPNPTNSTFTISAVGNQNIQITNAMGKEVYTNYNYIPQTEIDLSQEPTGIYFVKVGTTVKKLLLR